MIPLPRLVRPAAYLLMCGISVSCSTGPKRAAGHDASAASGRTVWQRAELPGGHRVACPRGSHLIFNESTGTLLVENGRAIMASGPGRGLPVSSWGTRGMLRGKGELTANSGIAISAFCYEGTFRLEFPGSRRAPITLKKGHSATMSVKQDAAAPAGTGT